MPAVQTNYATAYAVGYPGMVANGETSNRISRTVEDATAIPFGFAAFRGAGDHGVTATPAASAFIGVTIANYAAPPAQATGVELDSYPQYSTAGLLTQGVIWVTAGSNTTDGAAVYVTSAGAFTVTSSSNTAIPATFEDTVSSGALVRLRVGRTV